MEILSFNKAKEIWQRIVKSDDDEGFVFELEMHRRLLDLFHVGPHYYYIFNCGTGEFEVLDERASAVTGYPLEHISPRFLVDKLHPEDVSYFLNFENTITDFYVNLPIEKILHYKTSYDVRFRASNGKYMRILQQVTPIQTSEKGSIFRTLGVHTDISHMKPEGKPVLNIIGLNDHPSYYNVQPDVVFEPAKPILTKREQEVLNLIIEGKMSTEIADSLCISPETVKTHRKNIIRKSGSKNVAELVSLAVDKGLL
ncbi:hypothetical protein H8B06_13755 [Sphingobacterium sp. DN00404]|uniref:HTH luxR-type domain-containing protein n=1 Tax=Sphingobacterium micropteri TaxID=2763501 RepID=A0ABR7YRC1_9SPHI|nr:LuxR C-terminal-related transcriptional regulator [Sphingobacterium micropteri]MBD1433898.1 hypothetical protein [Sphingobacterium micropteri]